MHRDKVTSSIKYLVLAMSATIAISTSQADVSQKKIGDLEIYKAAAGGNVTIMMMLDTSGSMVESQGREAACEIPNVNYNTINEAATTARPYARTGCSVSRNVYKRTGTSSTGYQWYACRVTLNGVTYNNASSTSNCSYLLIKEPDLTVADSSTCRTINTNPCYYTKTKHYDRLTRLKDAIFTLMDNSSLDSSKVSLGIGQFSSQSDSSNTIGTPDGRSAKIVVPAKLLNSQQRLAIKTAVADMIGGNGTPTANAYAEAGAYMLGTTTTNSSYSSYSGFGKSYIGAKNGSLYKSPLANMTGQCNGQGIYFLTDGIPNSSSSSIANTLMSASLNTSSIAPNSGLINVTNGNDAATEKAWDYIGAYAKKLREATNPIRMSLKTATVGFGTVFDNPAGLPTKQVTLADKQISVTDCDRLSNQDAINLCKWGEKSYDYGEGGFYSAQSTQDVVDSVVKFARELNQTLPSTPSGTIVVPDDPYRADSQLAVAYYPILQAEVGKNQAIWAGNLKKYRLNEGTLYGKDNVSLFTDVTGALNPTTEDLWSALADADNKNNKVDAGGLYSNLPMPSSAVNNVRNLYIEDNNTLRKFGVDNTGKVTLDNAAITADHTFNDTATYSKDTVHTLLNYLGFNLTDNDKKLDIADLVLTAQPAPLKILGATIHATPSMVSYSATLDNDGKVSSTRDDYALFGSTDGALHLVNADDYGSGDGGKEKFVFIPKQLLIHQPNALKNGEGIATGVPYFGVDAPWLVSANYHYDLDNSRVTVQPCAQDTTIDPTNSRECRNTYVRAYGGLRMGGEGLYGLNLIDKDNPTMLFKIDASTQGFSRMGQIWSKPTPAKIKNSTTGGATDVIVFGGGYDTCYENEGFQVGVSDTTFATDVYGASCSNKSEARGNAVYIVDAKTGALIWSATNVANTVAGATNTTVSTLNNSIVAGITVLDRNNDGYMDQLYFADMGGQVFRADFTNAGFIKPVTSGTPVPETRFSNTRVVRILQPAFSGAETKYNHRFYERPVVSFYRGDNTFNNGRLFAMVNIISGDRSSPLSKLRDDNKYADRLYGIMDTDITLADNILYASDFATRVETPASGTTPAVMAQKIIDLTADTTATTQLLALPTITTAYNLDTKKSAIAAVKAKHGWYYPLTRFDGFDKVKYTKGVGKSEVINNFLYTTVYNPDMNYGTTDACAAKITGGSERQLYCLPYGICLKETTNSAGTTIDEYAGSKNGTGGFMRAGQGIQELILGPRSTTLSNQRLLIGTRTLTDRALDRVDFGDDAGKLLAGDTESNNIGLDETSQPFSGLSKTTGDGSAVENIYNDRYTLKPTTWYEVNQ